MSPCGRSVAVSGMCLSVDYDRQARVDHMCTCSCVRRVQWQKSSRKVTLKWVHAALMSNQGCLHTQVLQAFLSSPAIR